MLIAIHLNFSCLLFNLVIGWTVKIKTNFSKESPVWLLGKCYHKKQDTDNCTELGTDVAILQSQGEVII